MPQLENYKRALRLANPPARYCKVAQADDLLAPRCLEEMIGLSEKHPGIALVVAYTVVHDRLLLDGMSFCETVLDGQEVARRYLLGGPYVFGGPSNCLYRMSEVVRRPEFYQTNTRIGDAEAAMALLVENEFGFVHQVLSFERDRPGSISGGPENFGIDPLTRRVLMVPALLGLFSPAQSGAACDINALARN